MANHVVAVARHHQGRVIIAVVPRLVAGLAGLQSPRASAERDGRTDFKSPSPWLPIGANTWRSTNLIIPDLMWSSVPGAPSTSFRNVITGQSVAISASPESPFTPGGDASEGVISLRVADVLSICPVALLESETPGAGSGFQP